LKEVIGPGVTIVAETLNPVSILLDASVSRDVIKIGDEGFNERGLVIPPI
jgi:hypothetical protein